MKRFTPADRRVLQAIRDLTTELGYAPNRAEIARAAGNGKPLADGTLSHHLCRLREDFRAIEWETGKPRTIRIIDRTWLTDGGNDRG